MPFETGAALGISNRWQDGQCCIILTRAGLIGCGIYDVAAATHLNQAVAICRGTPACPLLEPEDLLASRIVDASPQAKMLGIEVGMIGKQAVELLLKAGRQGTAPAEQES
jgi:uncharacterized protein YunC (DUF1805 family)